MPQEPRIVKNKDIPLLSRVLCTMQNVVNAEDKMMWQQDRLSNITQSLSGMPGTRGMPSGFDATLAELEDLRDESKEQLQGYMRELKAAERIINSIASDAMRTFVVMYYVNNLPAAVIRRELNMTEFTFGKVRDAIERAEDMSKVKWYDRFITEK